MFRIIGSIIWRIWNWNLDENATHNIVKSSKKFNKRFIPKFVSFILLLGYLFITVYCNISFVMWETTNTYI